MIPLILLLAGAAFTAPVALADHSELELSSNPETLGAYVRQYFDDAPVMAHIAWCESRYRHLNPDGSIFRGEKVKEDIGVMQINTYYHQETADKLEIDLYSLEGNLEYARYLYEKQGTQPWSSSKKCWGQVVQSK